MQVSPRVVNPTLESDQLAVVCCSKQVCRPGCHASRRPAALRAAPPAAPLTGTHSWNVCIGLPCGVQADEISLNPVAVERPPAGICWRSRVAANRCAGTTAMRAGALRTACDAAPARAPVTSRMRSSWFMVDVPGNSGLPPSSSPRMHPARAPAPALARRRVCRRLSAVAHACTCGAAGRQCALAPQRAGCGAGWAGGAHRQTTCPRRMYTAWSPAGSPARGTCGAHPANLGLVRVHA